MKSIALLFTFLFATMLEAQTPSEAPHLYSDTRLNKLLGPIALYPDPLIAIILPAANQPGDIDAAAHYLRSNGDPSQIDGQQWDPSVRALAHYPDVLLWMNDNRDWTITVGDAFRSQEPDVMASIQYLRGEAHDAGNLESTPQQTIIVEGRYVRIVPAYREVIYVPVYDPDIIYYHRRHGYYGNMISFGIGWEVGSWLTFGMDWPSNHVWVGDYYPGWEYRSGYGRAWSYDDRREREHRERDHDAFEHHYSEPHRAVPVPRRIEATTPVRVQQQTVRPGGMGRTGRPQQPTGGGTAPAGTSPARTSPVAPTQTRTPGNTRDASRQQQRTATPQSPTPTQSRPVPQQMPPQDRRVQSQPPTMQQTPQKQQEQQRQRQQQQQQGQQRQQQRQQQAQPQQQRQQQQRQQQQAQPQQQRQQQRQQQQVQPRQQPQQRQQAPQQQRPQQQQRQQPQAQPRQQPQQQHEQPHPQPAPREQERQPSREPHENNGNGNGRPKM